MPEVPPSGGFSPVIQGQNPPEGGTSGILIVSGRRRGDRKRLLEIMDE
jgi:hypothetical protein